jgi:hypothetical protein
MEFNEIIAYVAIGIVIGVGAIILYAWYLYQRIKNRIDRMIEEVVMEAATDMIGLTIEVDQGQYFCYNVENKEFVCQGSTVAEIQKKFEARFPGKTAYLAGGAPEVVTQFRTELSQLNINENSSSI